MNEAMLKQWCKDAGPIPDNTCPKIDELIRYTRDSSLHLALEELREDNRQLRELGRFWYSKCQYMVGQLDKHGLKENNETHTR